MHLEPESENRAKNVHFHTTKNIQIQSTLFRYFQTNSYKLTSDLFTVVWPVHGVMNKAGICVTSWAKLSLSFTAKERTKMAAPGGSKISSNKYFCFINFQRTNLRSPQMEIFPHLLLFLANLSPCLGSTLRWTNSHSFPFLLSPPPLGNSGNRN